MYQILANRLRDALTRYIHERYGISLEIALEKPPKLELGELASPVCFELAKRLKRAPRQIAQEIAANLGHVEGVARIEVAGAGYLNAHFDRGLFWASVQKEAQRGAAPEKVDRSAVAHEKEKVIVEHTSINPNKAAHIGHLRNAVLGDSMARVLRHMGERVQVQNYIDNTGVQVADAVIGFLRVRKLSLDQVQKLAAQPKFDYLCWDVYADTTEVLEKDQERAAQWRAETLKAIEEGQGVAAKMAAVIANAVVSLHLKTMARLGISYDLLVRESEILHLKFWDAAFEKLKAAGAIQYATEGKNAGCWIMPWSQETGNGEENGEEAEPQAKIIVRSNGTVTYVGKDIAYQLWKFGLLGKDFHYTKWPDAPTQRPLWATTSAANDPEAPHFGEAAATVYNVIDSRQAYLQDVVAQGLRALGHTREAERSIHLSYDIVALTPRCARELGYELSAEEAKKAYVQVSGRKGLGVKADDLLDRLEAATLAEVKQRHLEMPEAEQQRTAHAIAVGALRFFLLKFTRTAIIAFDFKDALSFEGETGPYCQYAVVRIRGIRRKGAEAASANPGVSQTFAANTLSGAEGEGLWESVLLSGSLDHAIEAAIGAQEPAFVAKYAFQLAQVFNLFYHKHRILSEENPEKRAFLLRLTELVEAQLLRALSLLGIEAPEKM